MDLTPKQNREIAVLYDKMFQPLFQYAKSALLNKSLAEEAVQDTFRIACGSPDDLLNSPNPSGWLMLTLKNVIRNMRRSHLRQQKLMDKLISMAELRDNGGCPDSEEDISDLAETCLRVLGGEDFRLFWRVAADGLTMGDAAREFGLHTETCRKRIYRARLKLQKYLNNFDLACPTSSTSRTYTK